MALIVSLLDTVMGPVYLVELTEGVELSMV